MNNLGDILREARIARNLSQFDAADRVCSQSTLSEIEHNKYIPKPHLFIELCERLGVESSDLDVSNHFKACNSDYFNKKIRNHYDKGEYDKLRILMKRPMVIEYVLTRRHQQAYYLYKALCSIHLDDNYDDAKIDLKLVLANAGNTRKQTMITRLANIELAYVYSMQGFKNSALDQISIAMKGLDKIRYDENLNIVPFLAALSYHHLSMTEEAIAISKYGIDFAAQNNSNFLVINQLSLFAHVADESEICRIFSDFVHD